MDTPGGDGDSRGSSSLESYLDHAKAEGLSFWQARTRLKKPLIALSDSPQKAHKVKEKEVFRKCEELKAACDWEEIVSVITRYMSIFPPMPTLYMKRGEAYMHICDFQSAAMNFKKVLFHDPHNVEAADLYMETRFIQAQCFYEQRLFEEALQVIDDVVAAYPGCSLSYQACRLSCLAELGRYNDCFSFTNSLIDKSPDNADLYVARARLHMKFHNMRSSYYDLQAALHIDPEHAEARKHLQQLQAKAVECKNLAVERSLYHRWDEALQKISLAIETDPSVPSYNIFRGSLHRLARNYNAAVDDFLVALGKCGFDEKTETHDEATRQLVLTYNELAVDCFRKGYYNESVVLLSKAIKEDQTQKGLYCNRGDCFFKMGDLAFALADYEKALELCPSDWSLRGRVATVHCHIGVARYESRAYRECIEHFSAAIECNPGLAQPYACRAQAYFLMKKHTEAKHNVMAALYLDREHETALSLASRLFPGRSVEQVLNWPLSQQISGQVLDSYSKCHAKIQQLTLLPSDTTCRHRLQARQQSDLDYLLSALKLSDDVMQGKETTLQESTSLSANRERVASEELVLVPIQVAPKETSPRKYNTAKKALLSASPSEHATREEDGSHKSTKETVCDHVIVPLPAHVMPSFKACLQEEEFHTMIYYRKKNITREVHHLLGQRPPLKQVMSHLKAL